MVIRERALLRFNVVGVGAALASAALTALASAEPAPGVAAAMSVEAEPAAGASAAPPRAPRPQRPGQPSYASVVRKWHTPSKEAPARSTAGWPALVLEMVNTGERLEILPLSEQGGFGALDIERASHALRDPRADDEHPIDPRVLDLAYRVQCHFAAKSVRIVSAFRLPHGRSNHGRGRALDLVVPGAPDQEVARFARTIGFVGVGLYTRSGFVHVDSRSRSFFWVDGSGPGQRASRRAVFADEAARADRRALAKGESPPSDEDDDQRPATAQVSDAARFNAQAP